MCMEGHAHVILLCPGEPNKVYISLNNHIYGIPSQALENKSYMTNNYYGISAGQITYRSSKYRYGLGFAFSISLWDFFFFFLHVFSAGEPN